MKKEFLKYPVFIIVIVFFASSCDWMYKDPIIPAYIEIPSFTVSVQANQGTARHNITDAWVYINGKSMGAFELPAKFPVITLGESKIEIFAGIMLNGTAATRSIFSFINRYTTNLNLKSDSVYKISPNSTYVDEVVFEINEDFESIGYLFQETERSDTTIISITDPAEVFEGNASGIIYLDKQRDLFEMKSIETFRPKNLGNHVFVELHAKSDIPFYVGIISNLSTTARQHPVAVVTPSNNWKKLYINLTPAISRETTAINFNIFIASQLEGNQNSGKILLDNIKLIY